MTKSRLKPVLLALLVFFFLSNSACLSKASKPNLPRIFPKLKTAEQPARPPLVIIPGILGTELVNQKTGERLWPELFPRDRAALHLPITSLNFPDNRDDVAATRVIESAQLMRFLPELAVYGELLRALEQHGEYKRGDIDNPPPDGDRNTFYLFAYDWRRDNVESAQKLAAKLETIKQRLNKPELRFDIIAHSMGGLVARYMAMYGARDTLSESQPQPDWAGAGHINRLILFGTPNAGSMDAFRSVLRGYSVTEANKVRLRLFRALGEAMIFTVPSAYQLFPRNQGAVFLDAGLKRLDLDLFDIETWRTYGWSVAFDPALRRQEEKAFLKKLGPKEGKLEYARRAATRVAYLRAALARAAAFHRALDARGPMPEPIGLHLIGGDCEPTLTGALIVEDRGEKRTLFYPGKIPRALHSSAFGAIYAPGDGRVTRQSLFGLTLRPDSNDAILRAMKLSPAQTLFACEAHSDLPINPTMMDNLLTLLWGNRY
jgi:pimeloyl-ACP methyl ester carboxylesterase